MAGIDSNIIAGGANEFSSGLLTSQQTQAQQMENAATYQQMSDQQKLSSVMRTLDPSSRTYSQDLYDRASQAGISSKTLLSLRQNMLTEESKQLQNDISKQTIQKNIDEMTDADVKHLQDVTSRLNSSLSQVVSAYDGLSPQQKADPKIIAGLRTQENAAYQQEIDNTRQFTIQKLIHTGQLPSTVAQLPTDKQDQLLNDQRLQQSADVQNYKKAVGGAQKALQEPFSVDQLRNSVSGTSAYVEATNATLDQRKKKAELAKAEVDASTEARVKASEIAKNQAEAGAAGKQIEKSVDAQGNPVYDIIDKSSGKVIETAAPAPSGTAAGGGRAAVYGQRQLQAVDEVAAAAHSVGQLGVNAQSSSILGGAIRDISPLKITGENLANKLTDQDVQLYNTRMAGLARNLATLETAGLAAQGTLTKGLGDAVEVKPGDSVATRLDKMAEVRQIVDANIEASLKNPNLTKDQKSLLSDLSDRIHGSIPFTHDDVDKLLDPKNKRETMTSIMQKDKSKQDAQGGFISQTTLSAYAEKHGISVEDAKASLAQQGISVK